MARSPVATLASNGTDKPKRKQQRQLGPRTLWIVLKEGADANAIREQIESVTFNGREVLKSMGTGVTPAVIKMTVASEQRAPAGGSTEVDTSADMQMGTEGAVA